MVQEEAPLLGKRDCPAYAAPSMYNVYIPGTLFRATSDMAPRNKTKKSTPDGATCIMLLLLLLVRVCVRSAKAREHEKKKKKKLHTHIRYEHKYMYLNGDLERVWTRNVGRDSFFSCCVSHDRLLLSHLDANIVPVLILMWVSNEGLYFRAQNGIKPFSHF